MKSYLFAVLSGFSIIVWSCSEEPKNIKKHFTKKTREIVVKEGENKGIATLTIDGMSCEVNCARKIQETLSHLNGVNNCEVSFDSKKATVNFDHTKITEEALIAEVEKINDHQYLVKEIEVEVTKVVPDQDRK
jgi:mercuric ion binding protein